MHITLRRPAPLIASALLLACLFCAPAVAEPMVVTLNAAQSGRDVLKQYNGQALTLALEKTRAEYGDYRISITPTAMNTARSLEEARNNTLPNLVVMTTFQNRHLDNGLDYARFPVEYGVTGYRICFVSPEAKARVAKASSLDELRKFTIGQGVGWADVEILRSNQFKVVEVSQYESYFRMVAASRFDLLCRGINELEAELHDHADLPNLDYDRSMAIAYPLPRFFLSNKSNKQVLERIGKGLQLAHQDGSLRKLWLEQYGSALRFANLKQRKIFYLETPNIDKIDFDYKKYYFDPRKLME